MRIRVRKRVIESKKKIICIKIIAVFFALLADALIFLLMDVNPMRAYYEILKAAFLTEYGITETIVKFIPLSLISFGLLVVFKAQIWNIGAEGQLIMGAIIATWFALNLGYLPSYIIIPLMYIMGFIAGLAWAIIPSVLKIKLHVNEVLTTFMMNLIAQKILEYFVYGPWRDPHGWGFPQTAMFPENARLPILAGTRIHYTTLIISIISGILLQIMILKTTLGYEIKVVGGNIQAARYAGINISKIILLSMIISGGLAGVAGVGEVAGIKFRLNPNVSPGYGYTGIVIAWLGGLNPLGVAIATFLYSGLLVGGDALQVAMQLPQATINIFNGSILFFILLFDFFVRNQVVIEK